MNLDRDNHRTRKSARFLRCCLAAALALAGACTYQVDVDQHPDGFQTRIDRLEKKVRELGPVTEDLATPEAVEDTEENDDG